MRNKAFMLFIVALACLLLAASASAAPPAAAKAAAKESAPQAAHETIAFDDLPKYLGERITVHTNFHTTRTGVLTKASKSELNLGLETPDGETEFTIPRSTVAEVLLMPPAGAH